MLTCVRSRSCRCLCCSIRRARLPQFLLPNARSQEVGLWSLTKRWSTTAAIGNKFHPSELSVRTTGATFERNDGRSQEVQRSVDVLEIDQFNIPDRVWRAPMNSKDQPLKYQVKRTIPYNTLPVYSIMKPGLGQVWTVIKKIDGDLYVRAFRDIFRSLLVTLHQNPSSLSLLAT